MGRELIRNAIALPGPAVLGLALLLPVLVLGFWLFRLIPPVRDHSRGYAVLALLWGAAGAIGVALLANTALLGILSETAGLAFTSSWGAAITGPVNEETLKLAGLILLALMFPHVIRDPLSGFGYGALVGFGFQIVENYQYVFNAVVSAGGVNGLTTTVGTWLVRVLFSVWWTHWAFTGVAGAGLGYLIAGRASLEKRIAVAVGAYLLAIGMHFWWNSPIIGSSLATLPMKGLPILAIAWYVHRLASAAWAGRTVPGRLIVTSALARLTGRARPTGR